MARSSSEDFDMGSLGVSNSDLDFFSNSPFFKDHGLINNLSDDPFLTTLVSETNNNVLDVVDLPQNLLSPLMTQPSDHNQSITGKEDYSPSHESDSGVSDTVSVLGSPEHSFYDKQTSVDLNIDLVQNQLTGSNSMMKTVDEELESELTLYLNNDSEMHSPSGQSNADSDDLSFFKQTLDNDPSIEVSDDDFLPVAAKLFQPIQTNVKDTHNAGPRAQSGPSEVKILKVVRPSNSSAGVTSEDIAKAMEERSKKNAAQAKLNREKKKAYIHSLETEVDELKTGNKTLKSENNRMKQEINDKDEEIDYLKSVLANSSALSSLLNNITGVKDVKLSATIMTRKRAANGDHSYNLVENAPQKRARLIDENLKKAGVCLHVSGGSACLEFCAHCSKLAQKSHAHS